MEWWQLASMAGTIVATSTAVLALGWRVLEKMRAENRTAHDKIGKSISELRSDLTRDIGAVRNDLEARIDGKIDGLDAKIDNKIGGLDAKIDARIGSLRDDLSRDIQSLGDRLGAEIATNRQGMAAVGEGLAELRGELRGVNRSLQDLREDFRIHVYGGNAAA